MDRFSKINHPPWGEDANLCTKSIQFPFKGSIIYYVSGGGINGGSSSKIPDFCENDLFWPKKREGHHFENGIFQKYSTPSPHIVYDPSLKGVFTNPPEERGEEGRLSGIPKNKSERPPGPPEKIP